jgi:hypothetical protein
MSNLYNPYTKPKKEENPHMPAKDQVILENKMLAKKVRELRAEIELLKAVIQDLDEEYFNES